MNTSFFSPFSHGFARVAAAVPRQYLGNPRRNAEATALLARQASDSGARLVAFPELGLSGYSLDDLFHQQTIVEETERALEDLLRESLSTPAILCVGLPVRAGDKLFNAAAAVYRGRLLAITPKHFIPAYREFYEKRHFASGASNDTPDSVEYAGQRVPFGSNIILSAPACASMRIHMEICEDVWAPIPPSTRAALAGANVLINLSASNVTIGKDAYRRSLASGQSAKCLAAYIYSGAGEGESTNDLAWDGHAMIYENGRQLAETERFSTSEQLIIADIDVEMLEAERMRMTSFADAKSLARRASDGEFRTVEVPDLEPDYEVTRLMRDLPRFPYVPSDADSRDERCSEVYNIQVQALAQRLRATGITRVVLGISGGLDSTHALLVACRAMDRLGLPRTNIIARTMPGFATSSRTLENAHRLMKTLGVDHAEIDIRPSCMQMFRDIGHPYADGQPVYDVTFENVQAGERTSHLFRQANLSGGLVVGTGDLSELALGWATYGVGDHMSHYAVNASVPKTLIRYVIRWVADTGEAGTEAAAILHDIVNTEISPELVPTDETRGMQSSEATIGPYELQDFHLYYISRFGFTPQKTAWLAHQAWSSVDRGPWPSDIPEDQRNSYSLAEIKHWLGVFLTRFFSYSQFKRTCIPNGPKVGSGGSLSPRGDWRAPSDIGGEAWIAALERNVPDGEDE
ncbi:MAG: NAD(+) synthase [Spirochaetales bacterium]